MIKILLISAEMATLGLLEIKIFLNACYYVIIYLHFVTNKTISCDSKCIVDVTMWPKFYTSVEKGFKLKVRKFWGLKLEFVDVTGEKLAEGGLFAKFLTREKSFILDFRLGSEYTSAE